MRAQQWSFFDKSSWAVGPWQSEPDKAQWTDEGSGLPCLIVRAKGSGSLCGYVGISSTHPFFGKCYSDLDLDVHGGLTFASKCMEDNKEQGVCHIVEMGEDDDVWWFGFDCAHAGDYVPQYGLDDISNYRDWAYLRAQCAQLAEQLGNIKKDAVQ